MQDFIWLLRLISWLNLLPKGCEWDILDLFSGRARVSKWGRKKGLTCASYDILYHNPGTRMSKHSNRRRRSTMDINSEAGFTFPDLQKLARSIYACLEVRPAPLHVSAAPLLPPEVGVPPLPAGQVRGMPLDAWNSLLDVGFRECGHVQAFNRDS